MLVPVLLLLAVSCGMMALPLLAGQGGSIAPIVRFFIEPTVEQWPLITNTVAGYWLGLSVLALLAMKYRQAQLALAVMLVVITGMSLLSLLSPQHYVAALGFPWLGSGQGVIKFLALLMIALTLWQWPRLKLAQQFWWNYLPVALVLLWIGSLKFAQYEAQGIVDLVTSSPLLSWLYLFFDVQTAANLIGTYDVLAMLLLGAGYFWPRLFIPGFLLALAVFLTTQTFLFSFSGAWQQFGILSGSGVFIIKDLWFVANMTLMANAFYKQRMLQQTQR